MTALVQLDGIGFGTPAGRSLADRLSLELLPGELLLISGPNGSGKSTLLKVLLGKHDIQKGKVTRNVSGNRIGYIPQLENTDVHLPFTLRDILEMSAGRAVDRTDACAFGLLRPDQLDNAWNTASGGERKRTLLTRALLEGPRLLILDEPMNHLDPSSRAEVLSALVRFLDDKTEDRAAVIVCHKGLLDEEAKRFRKVHLDMETLALSREGTC